MDSNAVLRLTVIDGDGNSTELSTIKMSAATISMGRSNEVDISFGEDDQSVSRRQLEVSFNGGAPTLKNTGRNPVVYKNGKKQLAPGAQINMVSGLEVIFRESKLRFDVDVPAVYCLKTNGAGGRATFEIESERKYTVGRSPDCDITLDSAGVSRRHCKIKMESTEILNIHDLGSVNGVRLFLKGEVQEESADIEVPCGVKFIIGDIECILEKEGQGSGKKKRMVLPVVILLLLLLIAGFIVFFMLKDKPNPEPPKVVTIAHVQESVRADASFDKKADLFTGYAKDPNLSDLKPLCKQLAEYYSQCSTVAKLKNSLEEELDRWEKQQSGSNEQMKFEFDTKPSFKGLEFEGRKLETSYETLLSLMKENSVAPPERPDELIDAADEFAKKVKKSEDALIDGVTERTEKEYQENLKQIREIIWAATSFENKAGQFAMLAKEQELKSLTPLCKQLVEYYSQCNTVEKLNSSLSEEFEQQKENTRGSIEQIEFDFETSPSFERLKVEADKLERSYKTLAALMQKIDGIEAPESPKKRIDAASDLMKKAGEYEEQVRSLSFIWTDLEKSWFAASNFDNEEEELKSSIDALYPGEGLGSDVCAQIVEIINYRKNMLDTYEGLVGQIRSVLSNYTEYGVSEQLVPERYVMEPLRVSIGTTLPDYFEEPPPVTKVSSVLYKQLDEISTSWTNLVFLTYCGDWKSDLESRKSIFPGIEEAIALVDDLCNVASEKCAEDVAEGIDPYIEIKSKLEAGEELGFNDANKLIQVYDLCYEYLQNNLFCELQEGSKKEMEAVSADCRDRLYVQLKKQSDGASDSFDAAEQEKYLQNAKTFLEILDSAVYLPPDFETKIKGDRKWLEGKMLEMKLNR